MLEAEKNGVNCGPAAVRCSGVVDGCGDCRFAISGRTSGNASAGRLMLGAGGGWGSVGRLSVSLILVLPEYQKVPPVWRRITLCFAVKEVPLFPEEDGGADGVISGSNLVALFEVDTDAPAGFTQLGFIDLAKVFNDAAVKSSGIG